MPVQPEGFTFSSAAPAHTVEYLPQAIFAMAAPLAAGTSVLDVGCGNGYLAGEFIRRGCRVVGLDVSEDGIAIAKATYPAGRFEVLPADEHMLENLHEAPFDLVISTEVVEHLYAPRDYIRGCFAALRPGGTLICSTPYHGYLKNLVISLANKWDRHASPLWDGGHIKLWSRATLSRLMTQAGFRNLQFRGVGRFPYMWKSMVIRGEKPA